MLQQVAASVKTFLADESGANSVETGIVLGLIMMFLIGVLGDLANNTKGTFNKVSNAVKTTGS